MHLQLLSVKRTDSANLSIEKVLGKDILDESFMISFETGDALFDVSQEYILRSELRATVCAPTEGNALG